MDLMAAFEDLDRQTEPHTKIIRAPFGYPGGKSRSLENILPHLPYRGTYVEPFGGSGAVLLCRRPSPLEVFNDRYAGVVAFYRCMRNKEKFDALCDWLTLTVHAREEYVTCKETWKDVEDDVERAGRWYYMHQYSYANVGRTWGRSTKSGSGIAGKIRSKISDFPAIHARFKRVQVENRDWYDCLIDYDAHDTVFYLDPPYLEAHRGTYKHELNHDSHRRLMETIHSLKGFVAISGFANSMYDEYDWDNRIEWGIYSSIKGWATTEGNKKDGLDHVYESERQTEVLWIKE